MQFHREKSDMLHSFPQNHAGSRVALEASNCRETETKERNRREDLRYTGGVANGA